MSPSLFPRPTELYAEARRLAAARLGRPPDTPDGFDRRAWGFLADFDLFQMPFPERVGGLELAAEEVCDVLEGLGAGCTDYSLLFAAGAHMWAVIKPIVDFGSAEQHQRWLPPLMSGALIGAHAASEAGSGSDVMSMQTRYREADGGFVLDGSKLWVTNAPVADLFLIFATADPRLHFRGISAFLVPRSTAGLEIAPAEIKMGLGGAPLAALYLDGCAVPADALLGKPRHGSRIFQTSLAWERTFIQAPQIGVMRRQVERAIEHAVQRRQFGQPIGKFQAVSHRIVDMLVRYWQGRLILRMAARELLDRQETAFAAMSKLVLGEAALATHLDAVRTFGATGYMRESGVERDVRDALGGTLYSGTSDLQRNILAAALGL